ncbi:MAG: zinc-dependent alcohol dehydrogenase [Bacteroidota bacterium]
MKAGRFAGARQVAIETVPDPVPGPGEVLLKVDYCGLCGSERPQYDEGYHHHQGHEIVATVVEGGPGVKVEPGRKAAVYLTRFCGKCEMCSAGLSTACTEYVNKDNIGWGWPGGFAEYVVAPEQNLMYLAPELSPEMGVLLLDTLGTPFHGLRKADAKSARSAFVSGCGAVGLGTVCVLRSLGVPVVYAVDRGGPRLEEAEALGAIPIDMTETHPVGYVKARGGVDLAVEAAGVPASLTNCLRVVNFGGRVLALGELPDSFKLEVDLVTRLKDFSVQRTWYFPISEFEENQRLAAAGFFRGAQMLISGIYALDDMQRAADLFYSGKATKVLVSPDPALARPKA